jgi:hypothetical protein
MALTMINPASSWFKVVELPTIMQLMTKKVTVKREQSKKRSLISHLIESVNKLTKSGCVDTRDVTI